MKNFVGKMLGVLAATLIAGGVWAQAPAAKACELGDEAAGQTVADLIRKAGAADISFFPAGMCRDTYDASNLATLMRYPTDQVVVAKLTGLQVRKALERSLSLLPQPNSAFLQISGIEVRYSKTAPPESRVKSVQVGDAPLSDAKTYRVAMPSLLFGGALGFFKVWDDGATPVEKKPELTLESILGKQKAGEKTDRWISV